MCVCMQVYVYVCMHVCVHVCVCVCVCVCIGEKEREEREREREHTMNVLHMSCSFISALSISNVSLPSSLFTSHGLINNLNFDN